jgi:hypothetical protein
MSVVYPTEFDTDDLALVVERVRRDYSAHEVHPLDEKTMHFGYWDQELGVLPLFLHHIQAAGYCIIQSGVRAAPQSGRRCGWVEVRKYPPCGCNEQRTGQQGEDSQEVRA